MLPYNYKLPYYKIFYFLFILVLIYAFKPLLFFTPDGSQRQYGMGFDDKGYKKTLYSINHAIVIIVFMLSIT
uniref:Uncharacterized protein n=1 Tax=viral metagenome TaxID=1070528 RepID=A0A6C0DZL8_9ZZZZ